MDDGLMHTKERTLLDELAQGGHNMDTQNMDSSILFNLQQSLENSAAFKDARQKKFEDRTLSISTGSLDSRQIVSIDTVYDDEKGRELDMYVENDKGDFTRASASKDMLQDKPMTVKADVPMSDLIDEIVRKTELDMLKKKQIEKAAAQLMAGNQAKVNQMGARVASFGFSGNVNEAVLKDLASEIHSGPTSEDMLIRTGTMDEHESIMEDLSVEERSMKENSEPVQTGPEWDRERTLEDDDSWWG